jgi:hypothetical protein
MIYSHVVADVYEWIENYQYMDDQIYAMVMGWA